MNLRTVIVDDEPIVRQRLRQILLEEAGVEVVAECADGLGALTNVKRHEPDLLLLDVGMPGMGGFDVLEALGRRRLPLIVLVTAFDEYALRAFEACAIDYLLKPSSPERIRSMLLRVREHLALLRAPAEKEISFSGFRRFSVRSGQRTTFVTSEQIDWIEASGNYVILHVGNENHFLRQAIAKLEGELAATGFIRVSRSALVRVDRVKAIQAVTGGRHSVVLTNGQCVPITRGIRKMEARLRGA